VGCLYREMTDPAMAGRQWLLSLAEGKTRNEICAHPACTVPDEPYQALATCDCCGLRWCHSHRGQAIQAERGFAHEVGYSHEHTREYVYWKPQATLCVSCDRHWYLSFVSWAGNDADKPPDYSRGLARYVRRLQSRVQSDLPSALAGRCTERTANGLRISLPMETEIEPWRAYPTPAPSVIASWSTHAG
jgi:hypothetical protein